MASVVWNSTAETAGDIHDSGSDFSVCINSSFVLLEANTLHLIAGNAPVSLLHQRCHCLGQHDTTLWLRQTSSLGTSIAKAILSSSESSVPGSLRCYHGQDSIERCRGCRTFITCQFARDRFCTSCDSSSPQIHLLFQLQ